MIHEPDYSTLPLNTYEFAFPVLKKRENPFEVVKKISDEIGPRPVTSIAEAQVAAFMGGRLRRAGMQVWSDPFYTHMRSGTGAFSVAVLAAAVVIMWGNQSEYALASAIVAFLIAIITTSTRLMRIGQRQHESQNVVATQASLSPPTRRVVLLAPLDSHQPSDPLSNREARVGATAALLTFACIEFFAPLPLPELLRLIIMATPAVYLVVAASAELWVRSQPYSPGAVSYASALATMLTVIEDVGRLPKTEIWAVGLGGGSTGAGLRELLKRYPFDRRATFFIGLEGIGRGSLSYIINDHSHVWRPRRAAHRHLPRVGAPARAIWAACDFDCLPRQSRPRAPAGQPQRHQRGRQRQSARANRPPRRQHRAGYRHQRHLADARVDSQIGQGIGVRGVQRGGLVLPVFIVHAASRACVCHIYTKPALLAEELKHQ
jgi:hypothetical protein